MIEKLINPASDLHGFLSFFQIWREDAFLLRVHGFGGFGFRTHFACVEPINKAAVFWLSICFVPSRSSILTPAAPFFPDTAAGFSFSRPGTPRTGSC